MATKSITIKESAYEILNSRKRENESFSDLIERIGARRPLTELADVTS
ncbi:MAG: antitoxin VapB family protein, partial [Candidatus Nanohaloarchaea archaeon]